MISKFIFKMIIMKIISGSFLFILSIILISCNDNKNDGKGISPDLIGLSSKTASFSSKKDSVIISTQKNWWWFTSVSYQDKTNSVQGEDSIKGEWFQIIKVDNQSIKIIVDKNLTDKERSLTVTLEAGNYFDYISVVQK
jgi:hypothetical protein